MKWLIKIVGRLLFQTPPWYVLLIAFIAGFSLLLLSFAAQIAILQYPVSNGKYVGYATAPNWSFGFTILVPFAIMFFLATVQSFEQAIANLRNAGMLVKYDFAPTTESAIASSIADFHTKLTYLLVGGLGVGLLEGLIEWYVGSGSQLLRGNLDLASKKDWSVAALFSPPATTPMIDGVFGILAFLYQGIFIGVFISFLVLLCLASAQISRFATSTQNQGDILLVADLKSNDHRCGFEAFDDFFDNMLLFSAFAVSLFYLSQIQNNYLRNESTAKTMWEFLRKEFLEGAAAASSTDYLQIAKVVATNLFEPTFINFSNISTFFGALLLLVIVMLIIVIVLRQAALDTMRRTLTALNNGRMDPGKLVPNAQKKIEEMQVWPLAYMQFNTLVLLIATAILSIIFYKVGAVLAGLAAGIVLAKAVSGLQQTPAK